MSVKGIKFENDNSGHANTRIEFKGFIISIAMDDSCGAFEHFSRSDIRIFKDLEDVTAEFFSEPSDVIIATGEAIFKVMKKIERRIKNER